MEIIKIKDTVEYIGSLPFLKGKLGTVVNAGNPLLIDGVEFSSAKVFVEWHDKKLGSSQGLPLDELKVVNLVRLELNKDNFDTRMIQVGYVRIPDTNGWAHRNGYTIDDDQKPVPVIGNYPMWILYELSGTTPPPF